MRRFYSYLLLSLALVCLTSIFAYAQGGNGNGGASGNGTNLTVIVSKRQPNPANGRPNGPGAITNISCGYSNGALYLEFPEDEGLGTVEVILDGVGTVAYTGIDTTETSEIYIGTASGIYVINIETEQGSYAANLMLD